MMVVLNSRIVFRTEDESVMVNDPLPFSAASNPAISRRSAFGSISVTYDGRTAPFGRFKELVSICYESFPFSSILMFPTFVSMDRVIKVDSKTEV